ICEDECTRNRSDQRDICEIGCCFSGQNECYALEFEAGSDRISVEHPNRIQRELVKVFAAQFEEFFQNVVRHSNDMTTAVRGLENVKHLTDARPEEFSVRQNPHDLERLLHYRRWVNPGIGDSASED